jgi:ribonucleoside-diphosphate reductase alpha chain
VSREPLPTRRPAESFDFVARGVTYTATLGFYDDGRLGEVFLCGPKAGTDVEVNARDAAVVTSIALQHGASPEVLRHGLSRDEEGRALSPIGTVLDMLASGEAAE